MKCKWHDWGKKADEFRGDRAPTWWLMTVGSFYILLTVREGNLFSAHTGAIWHTGNTFVRWRKSSGSCLMMFSMCVFECVSAHLLKPQCLSGIHGCEDALADARETASFHTLPPKGMGFQSGQMQCGKNILVTLTFISTRRILTWLTTDGLSHFWLPPCLKA